MIHEPVPNLMSTCLRREKYIYPWTGSQGVLPGRLWTLGVVRSLLLSSERQHPDVKTILTVCLQKRQWIGENLNATLKWKILKFKSKMFCSGVYPIRSSLWIQFIVNSSIFFFFPIPMSKVSDSTQTMKGYPFQQLALYFREYLIFKHNCMLHILSSKSLKLTDRFLTQFLQEKVNFTLRLLFDISHHRVIF